MTTFTDLRGQLAQARDQRSAAEAQLLLQREQLRALERQIGSLTRQSTAAIQQRRLLALRQQAVDLATQIDRSRQAAAAAKTTTDTLQRQFVALMDPAQRVAQLSDSVPILLFPVRLEVRFRAASGGSGPQLWIRIYPDDCQIDSFEPMLTDTEIQNATAFWIAVWRAGKVEAQERGAWRSLVGGSGSGRAAYIVGQYAPTNPNDKPKKTDPQDVVLVIVPQTTVTPKEQSSAFDYWLAIWAANGDSAQEQKALGNLQNAVGSARAADLIAHYAPDAAGWEPPLPYTRAQVKCSCAVL